MEAFTTRERRKIIAMYRQGWDTEDVAQQMGASLAGVRRVWQQYREEGRDTDAYANCGRRPTLDEAGKRQVLELARQRPDAFCHELADEVERRLGVRVSRQTIGRWLNQLGLSRKKSRSMPASKSGPT
jgi:transposase